MVKYGLKLTFLLFIINFLHAQAPRAEKTASWFQQGYYILNPVFGNTTGEVAFVRRYSGRDTSVNPQASFLQAATGNYLPQNSIAARQLDPVVSIWDYTKRQLSLIDYGWAPAFSTNDNRLAYAFQAVPLKNPNYIYAEAYKGNTIKIFNRVSRTAAEAARPAGSYLLDPFFTDSLKLVYKTGERVNGPYGAAVSLSEIDLRNNTTTLIRQPGIRYRLYELIGETVWAGAKLAYIVYSPADSGSGMAGEYRHLLLSGKDTLHDFGVRKFTNLTYKFAVTAGPELLFLDDEHFMAEDTNYLVTYKNNRVVERKPLSKNYFRGYLSPDGRYLFYLTQAMEAYLVNTKDLSQTKLPLSGKELHAIVWNAAGNKLALVQDHERLAGTDEITIFTLR